MVSKVLTKPREYADNHELILDAAAVLLREVGYKKMTIDHLAKQAGLGKGTVYLYFDSKKDVALSFIDRNNLRLRARLQVIMRGNGPASERLRNMLIERVMFRFRCVQGHKEGIDDLLFGLRPQLFERRAKYLAEEGQIFAELLIEGRTKGEFQMDSAFLVADAFLDATNALLPHSLSPKQLGEAGQLFERTAVLTDLLVKAVEVKTQLANESNARHAE